MHPFRSAPVIVAESSLALFRLVVLLLVLPFPGGPADLAEGHVLQARHGSTLSFPRQAEAGMEDDKQGNRNLAKAEAARRLARIRGGVFWIGTEKTLTRARHYNLVFLHARRKAFPAFADISVAVQDVWPWGEVASVEEVEHRLAGKFPAALVEAAIWKLVANSAAAGHLLVDLEHVTLDRRLPLALRLPEAPVIVPASLPETLLEDSVQHGVPPFPSALASPSSPDSTALVKGPTIDASALPEKQRAQFLRNLYAVEQVLAGATQTRVAAESGLSRSTLSRLVQRTRKKGQIACVPHRSYHKRVIGNSPSRHLGFLNIRN
nr:helix-turn-helix domain-containing protein [Ktedonobacter robiniae]